MVMMMMMMIVGLADCMRDNLPSSELSGGEVVVVVAREIYVQE